MIQNDAEVVNGGQAYVKELTKMKRDLIKTCLSMVTMVDGAGSVQFGSSEDRGDVAATAMLPSVAITLFGDGSNDCVARLNDDAMIFNKKLNAASQALKKSHPRLKLVVLDIYNPLLDLITHPKNNGFFEARKACCGTGIIEASLLCNAGSPGTCVNATGYVFWDSFHPTDAANKVLSDAVFAQGIDLIS